MDWIDLAQDRDQWRTLVNTVNTGKFFVAAQLPVSREGLGSMSDDDYSYNVT
jgi:hypothetical protein